MFEVGACCLLKCFSSRISKFFGGLLSYILFAVVGDVCGLLTKPFGNSCHCCIYFKQMLVIPCC